MSGSDNDDAAAAEAVAKALSVPGRGWSNGDINEQMFAHSRVSFELLSQLFALCCETCDENDTSVLTLVWPLLWRLMTCSRCFSRIFFSFVVRKGWKTTIV